MSKTNLKTGDELISCAPHLNFWLNGLKLIINLFKARPEYRWSPSIVDVFSSCSSSVFCVFIFFHISPLLIFFNLLLLLAKFVLSIQIYEFSHFNYTLVFYKNVQTLFTDRIRNVVITKIPDKDMIVADHMNQVNLSCEAEGDPSVSFIWFSKIQT